VSVRPAGAAELEVEWAGGTGARVRWDGPGVTVTVRG
jgi:hypothetical protein